MEMNIIDELVEKYGGKVVGAHAGGDISWNGYSDYYFKWFEDLRDKEINVLEIGIFQGRSIAVWSDYFYNGKIYGVDWNSKWFYDTRDELINLGAYQNNNVEEIFETNSTNHKFECDIKFDIIIDDGDHSLNGQYSTFTNYFHLMKEGGLYIIEDAEHTATSLVEKIGEGEIIKCSNAREESQRNNKMVLIKKKQK